MKNQVSSVKEPISKFYRSVTSPLRRLPDFLVIGVVKGGTTSLYKYLIQHPQIASSINKEVKYFTLKKYDQKDVNWYRSHFPLKKFITQSRKFTGEASPQYFHNHQGPQLIHATVPEVKIVLLLRNPIDRAYSHYSMNMRNRLKKQGLQPPFSFEEMLDAEMEAIKEYMPPLSFEEVTQRIAERPNRRRCVYLSSGIYVYSLMRWLKVFPKENFLILKSEDLFQDPKSTTNEVYRFLGLSEYTGIYDPFNSGSYENMDDRLRKRMADFFKPYNELLYDYLDRDFGWE